MTERYDVTIVGGGHNALVAAAYLARTGLRVVVLERLPHAGGAAVSAEAFPRVGARLSRYSYLVALLPTSIQRDLGLDLELRSRAVASYTPVTRDGRETGLLVERRHSGATEDSFRALTGGDEEYAAWQRFYAEVESAAQVLAPTLTEPLLTAAEAEQRIGPAGWSILADRPIGAVLEDRFRDDTVRGVVATDALIGTFASLHDPGLVQNRCFLYHLVGNGTGEWRVPVGGMGEVSGALLRAALGAGAEVRTGCTVTSVSADETGAETAYTDDSGSHTIASRLVLSGVAPAVLDGLLGRASAAPRPEGAQIKINIILERLPQWRSGVDPSVAFAGTLHVAEGYAELEHAFASASAGELPAPQPGEFYCHSLTDPSILDPDLVARGFHTLTYFGVHTPARLFGAEAGDGADRDERESLDTAVDNALDALDAHLVEPIRHCLARDADGRPCLEAKSPYDIERALGMPGGHIFHGDLQWPWLDPGATAETPAERWGVETGVPTVLLCGSGARRGGAVSGLGGHNAAQAALEILAAG